MKRTFKLFFKINTYYDEMPITCLENIKAQCCSETSKKLSWTTLDNYNPTLSYVDKFSDLININYKFFIN